MYNNIVKGKQRQTKTLDKLFENLDFTPNQNHAIIVKGENLIYCKGGEKVVNEMTDKQLRYINRLTVFVRKLLKLVPQEMREELENEFDSILLEVVETNDNK